MRSIRDPSLNRAASWLAVRSPHSHGNLSDSPKTPQRVIERYAEVDETGDLIHACRLEARRVLAAGLFGADESGF
jgi:hypothetical protein